jgi:cytochrome c556
MRKFRLIVIAMLVAAFLATGVASVSARTVVIGQTAALKNAVKRLSNATGLSPAELKEAYKAGKFDFTIKKFHRYKNMFVLVVDRPASPI